jgi:hypothetical protein
MTEEFNIELNDHEITRRAYMAEAMTGSEAEIEADEAKAWHMLYGDLDEKQQQIYDMLVEQGVIPGDDRRRNERP